MSNATQVDGATEAAIRNDEREMIARRIRENVGIFADFATDKRAAVLLVALALELPIGWWRMIDLGQSPQHAVSETYCDGCGIPKSSGDYQSGHTCLPTA